MTVLTKAIADILIAIQGTDIVIPDFYTSIANGAFMSNDLTSVVIPDSVTSIGSSAFASNKLTSVEIGDGITRIEKKHIQQQSINECCDS